MRRAGPGRSARAQLRAATRAARRLARGNDDPEVLHDLRVALRRLRSLLRSHPALLAHGRHAHRRRLKRLARATNPARDADVLLALLGRYRTAGARDLGAAIAQERVRAYEQLRAEVIPGLLALAPRLESALRPALPAGAVAAVRREAGARAGELLARFAAQLAALAAPDDHAGVHAARITGKRLRYLLEPWTASDTAAAQAVKRLKRFQDDSGALCDRYLLLDRAVAAVAAAVRRRALGPVRKGAAGDAGAALAAAIGRDIARCHRALRRDYAMESSAWLRPMRRFAGHARAATAQDEGTPE
jgi:CHAD domain-containing protein